MGHGIVNPSNEWLLQIYAWQESAETLQKAKDWLVEHNYVINTSGLVEILEDESS